MSSFLARNTLLDVWDDSDTKDLPSRQRDNTEHLEPELRPTTNQQLLSSPVLNRKRNPRPLRNMTANANKHHTIYAICRTLPTFSRLSNSSLQAAINASISTYLPDLEAFDRALPAHFHRKSRAAWFEFTCVTVHVSNLLAGFCLSPLQTAAMMEHIDLLYRVDDFMETLFDAYGMVDGSVAFEAVGRCFRPYLGVSASCSRKPRWGLEKVDSPVDGLPLFAKPIQFEQDLQDVIDRMHGYPICDASEQDRQWYSLELYDFFVAQLEQPNSQIPESIIPGQVHKWVTDIGARSVGTKYMFAMFSCLISAVEGSSLWKTSSELFLAQEFAQQISVEFRVLNDVGGRVRDESDGTVSCCSLVEKGEEEELLRIAEFAAESSARIMGQLAGMAVDEQRVGALLDMFRLSVRVSGELYMVGEPNRVG
jgi:uncharacterized protein with PIN domain